jgi:hypothetical protein
MSEEVPLSSMAMGAHTVISNEDRLAVIERLMTIIKHPKATFRSITSAARALALYERVGLDAIRVASSCDKRDVEERLKELEERADDTGGRFQ